jgi:hypothetical protein
MEHKATLTLDPDWKHEVTPEMIEAGASVLWELEGLETKDGLAKRVFLAMVRAAADRCRSELLRGKTTDC